MAGPKKAFYFKGISSLDLGLRIESKQILDGAAPQFETYQVPGRDGPLYERTGYEPVPVQYNVYLKAPRPQNMTGWVGSVKAWLQKDQGSYFRLNDDYDLTHYRMAAYLSGLPVTNDWKLFSRMSLEFSAKPYRYLLSGEEVLELANGQETEVYNPTAFEALPTFAIHLGIQWSQQPITLTVEGEEGETYSQQLTGIPTNLLGGTVLVNSDTQTVRSDLPGKPMIPTAQLDLFPVLWPGKNKVTVGASGISSTSLTPYWREL